LIDCAGDDGIIEVKCPFVIRDHFPRDWPVQSTSSCLGLKDGILSLKKNSLHFYQILMQLYVTERKWCDYVVWSPNGIFIERINKSAATDVDWNSLKLKLEKFWLEDLAPELVDSRFERGYRDYRCPKNRLKARQAKEAAKRKRMEQENAEDAEETNVTKKLCISQVVV